MTTSCPDALHITVSSILDRHKFSTHDSEKSIHRHIPAVCQILKKDQFNNDVDAGTGFLIGKNIVMTRLHVVQDLNSLSQFRAIFYRPAGSQFSGNAPFEAKFDLSYRFPFCTEGLMDNQNLLQNLDFRILVLKGTSKVEELAQYAFCGDRVPEVGHHFNIIHHPLEVDKEGAHFIGTKKFETGGWIGKVEGDGLVRYTNKTSTYGTSGSPIFDDNGFVFALHGGKCENKDHEKCFVGTSLTHIFEIIPEVERLQIDLHRNEELQKKIDQLARLTFGISYQNEDRSGTGFFISPSLVMTSSSLIRSTFDAREAKVHIKDDVLPLDPSGFFESTDRIIDNTGASLDNGFSIVSINDEAESDDLKKIVGDNKALLDDLSEQKVSPGYIEAYLIHFPSDAFPSQRIFQVTIENSDLLSFKYKVLIGNGSLGGLIVDKEGKLIGMQVSDCDGTQIGVFMNKCKEMLDKHSISERIAVFETDRAKGSSAGGVPVQFSVDYSGGKKISINIGPWPECDSVPGMTVEVSK